MGYSAEEPGRLRSWKPIYRNSVPERKRNPHPLAVVAADLKAVGAPTPITFIHCNAAIMAPLVPANVAIEQQAVNLHDPVDSLVMGGFRPAASACRLRTAWTRR